MYARILPLDPFHSNIAVSLSTVIPYGLERYGQWQNNNPGVLIHYDPLPAYNEDAD